MAVKDRFGNWMCAYCGTPYTDQTKADSCRDSHDLIYVPFSRSDLVLLVSYLFAAGEDYVGLPEHIMGTLQSYLRDK